MNTTSTLTPELVEIDKIDKRTKEGKNYEELVNRFGASHQITLCKQGNYLFYAKMYLDMEKFLVNKKTIKRYVEVTGSVIDVPLFMIVDLYNMKVVQGSTRYQFKAGEEEQEHEVKDRYSLNNDFILSYGQIQHKLKVYDDTLALQALRDEAKAYALAESLDERSAYKLQNAKRVLRKINSTETSVNVDTTQEWKLRDGIKEVQQIYVKRIASQIIEYFVDTLENDVNWITDISAQRYTFQEVFYMAMSRHQNVFSRDYGNEVFKTFMDAVEWGY